MAISISNLKESTINEARQRIHEKNPRWTSAQVEMFLLTFLLSYFGFSYTIDKHSFLPDGFILKNIEDCRNNSNPDDPGIPVEGDFICGEGAYGNSEGKLEAGFGFGISEHTDDDVLGYLDAVDCLKLVMGEYWAKDE